MVDISPNLNNLIKAPVSSGNVFHTLHVVALLLSWNCDTVSRPVKKYQKITALHTFSPQTSAQEWFDSHPPSSPFPNSVQSSVTLMYQKAYRTVTTTSVATVKTISLLNTNCDSSTTCRKTLSSAYMFYLSAILWLAI